MKIQETLQIGLRVGGSFLVCGMCATLADRIAFNFFKNVGPYCLAKGTYLGKTGLELLKKAGPYCLSKGPCLGKMGLELLKKGVPYYVYSAIFAGSLVTSLVTTLIAFEKLKIDETKDNFSWIHFLSACSLTLIMVTLLAPPITKRLTNNSIGYVQSAWHGLETIILSLIYIGSTKKVPESEELVKDKSGA